MNNLKIVSVCMLYIIVSMHIKLWAQIDPVTAYKDLFEDVQKSHVFNDQKRFLDCPAKYSPQVIHQKYLQEKKKAGFDVKRFVGQNFDTLLTDTASLIEHIDYLWSLLTRQPDAKQSISSLIPLPKPYIVPGGRFREVYYWDSYFTMLGLQEAKKFNMIENMVDNFSYLLAKYGHIPNGNRTYYLSRSQPPFFSLMVTLLADIKGDSIYIRYLPYLVKEYQYWMAGMANFVAVDSMKSIQHIVKLGNEKYLNRYWDEQETPRPESYLIDVKLNEKSGRNNTIYRDIRAAAESGWDFSSRWFTDNGHLASIQTTHIVPVDLNCLLYHLEQTISLAYHLKGKEDNAKHYQLLANGRKELIMKYCWDKDRNYFVDYDLKEGSVSSGITLAGLFPLFVKMVSDTIKIRLVIERVKHDFLKEGGLVTTTVNSGEQWDFPNGWAPLQWIGYQACLNYSAENPQAMTLAREIASRWINLNCKVYFETGKMLEKYNVVNTNIPGGGGEYPLQDGFGWTNGVFLKMWNDFHKQ